jgi:integrase
MTGKLRARPGGYSLFVLAVFALIWTGWSNPGTEFASHALWLLLLTGVRRNEILAAKWADIDWDNKTLYIGTTKNGEDVLTPLGRAAIARLKLIPRLHYNPYIVC